MLTLELERTEEQNTKLKTLASEISFIQEELKTFQISQVNLYNTTPEVYARNKTIMWYFLNISYKDGEKLEPFFGEGDLVKKNQKHEEYEDLNDSFINKVITEFLYYTAVYYNNLPSNEQEFNKILEELKKQNIKDEDIDKVSKI